MIINNNKVIILRIEKELEPLGTDKFRVLSEHPFRVRADH